MTTNELTGRRTRTRLLSLLTPLATVSLGMALLGSLVLGAAFTGEALAQTPDKVNYQGFLRNDDGSVVNGPVDLRFSIYDAETGGSLIWTETQFGISVDEGLFHAILGSQTALTEASFSAGERWLQTAISGETPFPRRQFLATPYAMHATVADVALSGGGEDTDWTIDGANIYRTTGKVGIGTSTFGNQLLYVASDVVLGGSTAAADGNAEWVLINGQSEGWVLGVQNEATESASDFYIGLDPNAEDGILHIERDGDVGIGTTTPQSKLTVVGDVDAMSYEATTSLGASVAPADGAVHADNVIYAWAKIRGDGVILESYGVSSVNHFSTGSFEVILERPLPGGMCPTITPWVANDPVIATATTSNDRVDVKMRIFIAGNHGFQAVDYGFFIQVVGRP